MRKLYGFSMIELMLVVLIIMIVSVIAVPQFVKSYRGAKLRTSARTVVMSHRHARSMAVLGQKQIAILYDTLKSQVEVVSVGAGGGAAEEQSKFLDSREQRTVATLDEERPEGPPPEDLPPINTELIRALETDVKIVRFVSEKKGQTHDGIYWVNYYPNGMCDPYEMELEDSHDKRVSVKVDPLSGKVAVEYE